MTYRCLHGFTFKVWSPSHYELSNVLDDGSAISLVSINFDGEGWLIHVLMKKGHIIRRGPYPSFASAVQVIAFGEAKEKRA
jgi:hypothetical protein